MTILFMKLPPSVSAGLLRLVPAVAIFLITVANQARAADPQVWQGQYESNALQTIVSVRLTLDASPPELRFEPLGCSVGLKPVSKDSISVYSIVRYKEDELSGPYCGSWVGGRLEIRPVGAGRNSLTMKLLSSNGKSQVDATLKPASEIR